MANSDVPFYIYNVIDPLGPKTWNPGPSSNIKRLSINSVIRLPHLNRELSQESDVMASKQAASLTHHLTSESTLTTVAREIKYL